DPADTVVDGGDHRGVVLHVPGGQSAGAGLQVGPVGGLRGAELRIVVAWGRLGVRADHAELLLTGEPLRTDLVPAGVVAPAESGTVVRLGVHRGVHGGVCEVHRQGL